MKLLYDDKGTAACIVLESRKELEDMVKIMERNLTPLKWLRRLTVNCQFISRSNPPGNQPSTEHGSGN
jgi:hypothetical protein